ncbi:hypothetical protein, partial [Ralstonia solanacearum]|uniref:hypothetical protein n=1 Tax=Ralstonia solanacearum TaxID=305 RepID=UPI001E371775
HVLVKQTVYTVCLWGGEAIGRVAGNACRQRERDATASTASTTDGSRVMTYRNCAAILIAWVAFCIGYGLLVDWLAQWLRT